MRYTCLPFYPFSTLEISVRELSSCPMCGSSAWRNSYIGKTTRNPDDPSRWIVAQCSACDHGFLNPQPTWDKLNQYYNANYQPYDASHGLTESLESTVAKAESTGVYNHVAIRPGLRILDVGAGGGSFLTVAKTLGAHTMGVEPSTFGVRAARANGLDIFEGTLEQYVASGVNERFDLITFSHVIEHLPDPIGTLTLAASLLADGGRIWLAVPNAACHSARRLQWRWHSADLPIHLHHFSPQSMRVAAEKAGLSLHSLNTYSLPAAVRSSLLLEWRHRWMVPQKVGSAVLSTTFIEQRASRMDKDGVGEAILAEFTLSGTRKSIVACDSVRAETGSLRTPACVMTSGV